MTNNKRTLKNRFLQAIIKGELGTLEKSGVIVTLKEFKSYFSDINTQYLSSFLPAATLEPGQYTLTHTRFLFRVSKGVYLVHPDLLAPFMGVIKQNKMNSLQTSNQSGLPISKTKR